MIRLCLGKIQSGGAHSNFVEERSSILALCWRNLQCAAYFYYPSTVIS